MSAKIPHANTLREACEMMVKQFAPAPSLPAPRVIALGNLATRHPRLRWFFTAGRPLSMTGTLGPKDKTARVVMLPYSDPRAPQNEAWMIAAPGYLCAAFAPWSGSVRLLDLAATLAHRHRVTPACLAR